MKRQVSSVLAVLVVLSASVALVSSAYRSRPRRYTEDVHLVRESRQVGPTHQHQHSPLHQHPQLHQHQRQQQHRQQQQQLSRPHRHHAPSHAPGPAMERQASSDEGSFAPEPDEARNRYERGSHDHHEHVDYGAHTGHKGAFGWYADFPVKGKD